MRFRSEKFEFHIRCLHEALLSPRLLTQRLLRPVEVCRSMFAFTLKNLFDRGSCYRRRALIGRAVRAPPGSFPSDMELSRRSTPRGASHRVRYPVRSTSSMDGFRLHTSKLYSIARFLTFRHCWSHIHHVPLPAYRGPTEPNAL